MSNLVSETVNLVHNVLIFTDLETCNLSLTGRSS